MDKDTNLTELNNAISIDRIHNAQSLEEVNLFLTRAMASHKIQALIKGENLNRIAKSVMALSQNQSDKHTLLAAAMLNRLAAVARNRGSDVLKEIPNIITKEPSSLDILFDNNSKNKDSDTRNIKYYASQSFRYINADWVSNYCLREAVNIDTSENARREFLNIAMENYGNAAEWLRAIAAHDNILNNIENIEIKMKRIRRLFSAILEQLQQWQGELGEDPGEALERLFANFISGKSYKIEDSPLFEILDYSVAMLLRLIEMRFSIALYAKTYAVILKGKKIMQEGDWYNFLQESDRIKSLRICLLEAALVLARQSQTDSAILAVIMSVYASKPQVYRAIKNHFQDSLDLDPECSEWWHSAGEPAFSAREVEHKFHNTEDEQIGLLLLEVESGNKEIREQLERTVIPMLKTSDPVLASNIEKFTRSYTQIVQTVQWLAKMRKVGKTDVHNMILQYNRNEHEMLKGHKPGIRRVRIIRDGITKEFGGRKKTLVKAFVEPVD